MSQDPPRRDPNVDDRTLAGAPGGGPRHDETVIGGLDMTAAGMTLGARDGGGQPAPGAYSEVASAAPSATPAAATLPPCPGCGQVPEHESRFCQTCGRELDAGAGAAAGADAPDRRLPPWLIPFALVWVIIMIAAFYFIYEHAFMIGSI